MSTVSLTADDALIYEREIRPCLPEYLFDAHTHLLGRRFHPRLDETMPLARDPLLGDVDLHSLQAWWGALFPHSRTAGMVMGFPTVDVDMPGENAWVSESARPAVYPHALLVRPELSSEVLEAQIELLRPAVLKPYLIFAQDPAHATITDIIPEHQIALADKHGLAIMLHVSRPAGMADAANLDQIQRLVREYPRCQFILAHCGRCFIAPNMELALERLPVAENLWLDTSAVCDAGVFLALLAGYDRGRILFGTDLVTAAGFRGSYVRLGMSWHVCTTETISQGGPLATRATFAAYESLAALCFAVRFLQLSASEREALFFGNACGLFGYSFDA